MFRPWPAADGLLVRIRLLGGRIRPGQLAQLVAAAQEFGDGRVRTTQRANLQLRGWPGDGTGRLAASAQAAVLATGLVPSEQHDLVRNVMVSPLSGIAGGRADLRGVAARLDAGICASPALAGLPGKFLFVLDDGRGDLLGHACDLGLVALDGVSAQLREGSGWGPVVALEDAPGELLRLAQEFVAVRGAGPDAAWHVSELTGGWQAPVEADGRLPGLAEPVPFGRLAGVGAPGWVHVAVGEEGIDAALARRFVRSEDELVVTPWRGVLVHEPAGPGGQAAAARVVSGEGVRA